MPQSLVDILQRPPTGRPNALIVDCHAYAEAVLLQGRPLPWAEPMACANQLGQAYTLLRSDAAVLDLGRFASAHLRESSALQEAMGARSRSGYALRTLLNDDALTEIAASVVTTVTATQRIPVMLTIPSPELWLTATSPYSSATDAFTQDHVENAAIYLADWLRAFGGAPLTAIVLDHRANGAAGPTFELAPASLSPLSNLARHYDWDLLVRRDAHVASIDSEQSIDVLPSEFWLDARPLPVPGRPHFTSIPPTANPEHVLHRIDQFAH